MKMATKFIVAAITISVFGSPAIAAKVGDKCTPKGGGAGHFERPGRFLKCVADAVKIAEPRTSPSAIARGELPPGHQEGRHWASPHERCTSADGSQSGDVSVGPPGGRRCEYDRAKVDLNKGTSKN